MKKIIFFTIAFSFLFSCKNKQQELALKTVSTSNVSSKKNISNSAKSEYLSKVDTSKISTFDDYYEVKDRLFSEYYDVKDESFSKYYDQKNESFTRYYDLKQSSIKLFREENNSLYLKWLDAGKINDYETSGKIEGSLEFRKYFNEANIAYEKHLKEVDSLYKLHLKVQENSYKEYLQKVDLAYTVYQSKQ